MAATYKYAYPNWKSYSNIPPRPGVGLYNGQLLRHGYIYGYKPVKSVEDVNKITGPSDEATRAMRASAMRQLDWNNVIVFQFNPPSLDLAVQMMNSDNPEMENPEGNLPGAAVGLASTMLELYFDRTNEVARATAGAHGRAGEKRFKELGVQCDLFDLLKVMSGGDSSVLVSGDEQVTIDDPDDTAPVLPGSMNDLTGQMFDAVISGSKIYFKPFVVVFNQNLAVHVQKLSSFAFSYLRFTADLVPTHLKVSLGLEITNMGTKAYAAGGPTGTSDGTSSSTTTPPPGGPPDQSTTTPRNTYF